MAKNPVNAESGFDLKDHMHYQLLKKRTIVLYGEIEEDVCANIISKLLYLSTMSNEPIKIILNSVGGSVLDGFLVLDTIEKLVSDGYDIIIEATGLAASMGLYILLAGSTRRATPRTRFLLHEISMGGYEYRKVGDWEDEVKELEDLQEMMAEYIVKKTELNRPKLKKLWNRKDYWFGVEKALKMGFIDEIVGDNDD